MQTTMIHRQKRQADSDRPHPPLTHNLQSWHPKDWSLALHVCQPTLDSP